MPVVKRIVKLGDAQGVVLDTRVLRLANLAVGDEVEVSVDDGRIVLTPHRRAAEDSFQAAADRALARHGKALKRLAR
jgi:antitoxin component of MazEF toxin-antitoxin module